MRFCLVIPPSIFLLDERVFPSLGILRVAAMLDDVEVLDLSGIRNFEEVVERHAAATSAEVFGVTATTPQMPAAHKILRAIQRGRPQAHVVLGGPHATLVHAASERGPRGKTALAALTADWPQVVAGDGERAIKRIEAGDRRPVINADDPDSPLFIGRRELDEFPRTARHLIDLKSYHYKIEGYPATSLIAQLGCPFECSFCGGRYSPMLRRIRTRSHDSIIEELRHLHEEYGYTGFMFYDDELNVSGKNLVDLCDAITKLQAELGVEFRLRGFIKAELFDKLQAEAMYRAGFRWMLVGFESGSPRILENIQKKATRDDNTRCLELAHAAGLKVKALMSIGHAGESPETCMQTEEWLLEARPDDFDVSLITAYPGTPYYDDVEETEPGVFTFTTKSGDRFHSQEIDYNEVADYFKGDPNGGYRAYVHTDYMTGDDLVAARGMMETRVRKYLGVPWHSSAASQAFDHSMGQLPATVLRSSAPASRRSVTPTRRGLRRAPART